MRYTWVFASLFLLAGIALAQTQISAKDTARIAYEYGGSVLINKLGTARILFKDHTIKKNCTIIEIKEYWVVFMKDKSLHDAQVDKIKYIELDDQVHAVYFDSKNKPVLKRISGNTY